MLVRVLIGIIQKAVAQLSGKLFTGRYIDKSGIKESIFFAEMPADGIADDIEKNKGDGDGEFIIIPDIPHLLLSAKVLFFQM